MSEAEEENKRISVQVSSLSTQLIESIEKQSKLEEQLFQYKREHETLKIKASQADELRTQHLALQQQYQQIVQNNNGLGKKLELESKEKLDAKEEVSKLQSEVEELSASLFGEANKMVNDARRQTHEVEKRNESLVSQLKEKDLLLDNLQNQLKELKNTLHERDSESVLSTRNSLDDSRLRSINGTLSNSSSQVQLPLVQQQPVIYSPTTDAIRFDLEQYSEYKKFISAIPTVESIRHTDTKFLKRLIADDIEPALRIDLAPGISWLSKRSIMSSIIDGRVAIEPISGINETYRLNFQTNKSAENEVRSNLYSYPSQSPPVAIDQPCALCGEERNDILEHSRLYIMKIHPKTDSSSSTINSINTTVHQYPLCSFCLFRVRSTSELFAFLRSLKTDAWKLTDEITIKKSWVELSRLRCKLFWSVIGIWDIDTNIITTPITPSTDENLIKINTANSNTNVNCETNQVSKTPGELIRKGSSLRSEIKQDVDDESTIGMLSNVEDGAEEPSVSKYDGSYTDIVDDYEEANDTPDEAYEEANEDDEAEANVNQENPVLDQFINSDNDDSQVDIKETELNEDEIEETEVGIKEEKIVDKEETGPDEQEPKVKDSEETKMEKTESMDPNTVD